MRLTRTPVRTAYRPTPIPPPLPGRRDRSQPVPAAAPHGPGFGRFANGEPEVMPVSRAAGPPILLLLVAGLLIIGLAGIAAIFVAGAYGLSPAALIETLLPTHTTPVSAEQAAPSRSKPVSTPRPLQPRVITSRAWSMWNDVSSDPFDPTIETLRLFQPARTFPAGVEFIEGGTMQSEQTRIRLAEIVSIPSSAICLSDQSMKVACGLMARASLSILVGGQKVVCYPDMSLETENPLFLCQARGRDLSLAQIEAGFALPSQPSIAALSDLAAKAHAAHAGAWNGEWTVLAPGGSPVTAK